MSKTITISEAKWKRLENFMGMLERHFTGKLDTPEWITETKFKELTGKKTKEQLRYF